MVEEIRISTTLPAEPEQIYRAWMDSAGHSAFTGSPATIDPTTGGAFSAWDGYIQGTTLELEPYRRIIQAWRTTEFPEGSPDSRLEVLLEATDDGTLITLHHSNIPVGQGEGYYQGWIDYYFEPMIKYFSI